MSTRQLCKAVLLAMTGCVSTTNAATLEQYHQRRNALMAPQENMPLSPFSEEYALDDPPTMNILPPSSDCDHHVSYSITSEQVLRQTGFSQKLPAQAITVKGADYNTVTVDVTFGNTSKAFVQYQDAKHYKTNCDVVDSDFGNQQTMSCWDGYATLAVFVYYDLPNIEDCQGCAALPVEEDDDSSMTAYYLEIPCTPNCIEDDFDPNLSLPDFDESDVPDFDDSPFPDLPQQVATEMPFHEEAFPQLVEPEVPQEEDCSEQHYVTASNVVQQAGDVNLPTNALQLLAADHHTVTLRIAQALFATEDSAAHLYVNYYDTTHYSQKCEGFDAVTQDNPITITAQCFDGIAEIRVFVYLDTSVELAECNGCAVSSEDDNDDDTLAYSLEVPCQPLCDELPSPTAAPELIATTQAPIDAPVPIETSPPKQDDDCATHHHVMITDADVVQRAGAPLFIPDGAIQVLDTSEEIITVQFNQVFSSEIITMFVQYDKSSTHTSVCDDHLAMRPNMTTIKSVQCYNGYAQMSVFLYLDLDLNNVEECKGCAALDAGDENVAAYYFEWECKPSMCDYPVQEVVVEEVPQVAGTPQPEEQQPMCGLEQEDITCSSDCECGSLHGMDQCVCEEYEDEYDEIVVRDLRDEENEDVTSELDNRQLKKKKKKRRRRKKKSVPLPAVNTPSKSNAQSSEKSSSKDYSKSSSKDYSKSSPKDYSKSSSKDYSKSSSKSKSKSKSESKDNDDGIAPQLVPLAKDEPCCECECFPKPCSCSCRCLGQVYTMDLQEEEGCNGGGRDLQQDGDDEQGTEIYDDDEEEEVDEGDDEEEEDAEQLEHTQVSSIRGGNSAKQRGLKKKKKKRKKRRSRKKKYQTDPPAIPQPEDPIIDDGILLPRMIPADRPCPAATQDNRPWDVHEWWTCGSKDELCASRKMPEPKRRCKKGTTGVCKGKANGHVPDFMHLRL